MRSSDGETWVDVSPPTTLFDDRGYSSNFLWDLWRLDSGRFVAVGENAVYTSDDGETWAENLNLLLRESPYVPQLNAMGAQISYHGGIDDFPGPIPVANEPDPGLFVTAQPTRTACNGLIVAARSWLGAWDVRRNISYYNYKPAVTDDGVSWTPELTDPYDPES